MNWLVMFVVSLVMPIVQPMVQQGVNNVQAKVQQRMQQPSPNQIQPPQYYYDGKDHYCFYNGQWWIWKQQ